MVRRELSYREKRHQLKVITALKKKGGVALLALLLCGCGSSSDSTPRSPNPSSRLLPTSQRNAESPSAAIQAADDEQLALLWRKRSADLADFPIGPGDLLEVSVPGIDQLRSRTERVGGDGHIYLPLAGDLVVAGKTEKWVREELNRRMEKYLYHPQASIFVKSYSSRQVAVMGAVSRPGMYVLHGPQDSVRILIERAGGMTDNAAREVLLTPARPGRQDRARADMADPAKDSFSEGPVGDPALDERADSPSGDYHRLPSGDISSPIRSAATTLINLAPGSGQARYMDLPVRPGDTIYVPPAGSVTVVGWVYTPKTIPITPGLTVLGAVSDAGGPLFAADTKTVKLIRQKSDGRSEITMIDLDEVKERKVPNTPVEANDIIDVSYSTARLPGYAVYYAMIGIFQWAPATVVTSGL